MYMGREDPEKTRARAKAWYWANRERSIARNKIWVEKNRERSRQIKYEWGKRNPEKALERKRRARRNNPEKYREDVRRWRRENKEKFAISNRKSVSKYRHRLLDNWKEDVYLEVLFKRDGGICGICSSPVDDGTSSIDHIVPVSRGGEHSYANTRLAHWLCNSTRGARMDYTPTTRTVSTAPEQPWTARNRLPL